MSLSFICTTTSARAELLEVLGLADDYDADEATITRAYRKLALRHHPDRNPEDVEKRTVMCRDGAARGHVRR